MSINLPFEFFSPPPSSDYCVTKNHASVSTPEASISSSIWIWSIWTKKKGQDDTSKNEITDEEMIVAIVVAGGFGGQDCFGGSRQTSSVSEQGRELKVGGKTMHYCLSSSLNLAEAQHWQTTLCR